MFRTEVSVVIDQQLQQLSPIEPNPSCDILVDSICCVCVSLWIPNIAEYFKLLTKTNGDAKKLHVNCIQSNHNTVSVN